MATVEQQVHSASEVICQNIASAGGDRGLLSQNILGQLRNLVEGLIVWSTEGSNAEFHYDKVGPALVVVRGLANHRLLSRFHSLLQASVSHYTLDADPSERLMLKYYEYLLRIRDLATSQFGVSILHNIEQYPIDTDPSLREYHDKIAECIQAANLMSPASSPSERYYIRSSRPFFVDGRIFYEITFSYAHDRASKFDRIIGFTDIDLTENYAASMSLLNDIITVDGRAMPIVIVRSWEVSIRPCEFDNFARYFGAPRAEVRSSHTEYRNLMRYLTETRSSLLDLMKMSDAEYESARAWVFGGSRAVPLIFATLDRARELIQLDKPGSRLLTYLMLRMNNRLIKDQFALDSCYALSGLRVSQGCRPFDTMPFCTSPRKHTPRFADLAASLNANARLHELLARRIRNNVEQHGVIYTPIKELEEFGELQPLVDRYNALLPPTQRHASRRMTIDRGHVFIAGYEDSAVEIIDKLQARSSGGISNYSVDVHTWLKNNSSEIDDPDKQQALQHLFSRSKAALIYGAAGTGKSTMVNHIAGYFSDKRKLFLAHTNPAVDNLRRRVTAPNSEFSTIRKQLTSRSLGWNCDVLVIDECSTVGNASLLELLESVQFDLLVLVGDVFQIESIEFGNWFSVIRSYIPEESVFELKKPYRATSESLLELWERVRNLDDKIEESLSKNAFSAPLDDSLFTPRDSDEIVLCLNYDGLYGINNINRFLQAANNSGAVPWNGSIYKVGDPVLFNDSERFRPVLYNNLKGRIDKIDLADSRIIFDVELDREVGDWEVVGTELTLVSGSIVRFEVLARQSSDDDDDSSASIVPFQIAYAVSIHKAQGLEFESVKVVITDANEQNISHAIFYTAITRARKSLKIYWTPETQQRVLDNLAVRENWKDESLLQSRRGIMPVVKKKKKKSVQRARP